MLNLVDVGNFHPTSFSKEHGVTRRTVERDIKLLKEKGLILTEGRTSAVKYKVTEKYKQLKKKL